MRSAFLAATFLLLFGTAAWAAENNAKWRHSSEELLDMVRAYLKKGTNVEKILCDVA